VQVDLDPEELEALRQMLSRALDQVGTRLETLEPRSDEWERAGRQLGFLNSLLGKLYPPVEADEAARTAESTADGVLSGDIRHLIDYIYLPRRADED